MKDVTSLILLPEQWADADHRSRMLSIVHVDYYPRWAHVEGGANVNHGKHDVNVSGH